MDATDRWGVKSKRSVHPTIRIRFNRSAHTVDILEEFLEKQISLTICLQYSLLSCSIHVLILVVRHVRLQKLVSGHWNHFPTNPSDG